MRFAVFALIASAAQATTITINDQLVSMIGENWQRAGMQLQRTLEDLQRQEQRELEPYIRSLQKDAQTIVDIDMRYGERWAKAAEASAKKSWTETKAAMGCSTAERLSPYCDNPGLFFERLDRALKECKCTNFPVQISNSKMECSVSASGKYMCI